jgi:hypothetical protein
LQREKIDIHFVSLSLSHFLSLSLYVLCICRRYTDTHRHTHTHTHLCRVNFEKIDVVERDDREGLVDFPEVNVTHCQPVTLQQPRHLCK